MRCTHAKAIRYRGVRASGPCYAARVNLLPLLYALLAALTGVSGGVAAGEPRVAAVAQAERAATAAAAMLAEPRARAHDVLRQAPERVMRAPGLRASVPAVRPLAQRPVARRE
jgi:hypothetical protein